MSTYKPVLGAVPKHWEIIKFGSKQVYLPKFTVALIRSPHLSPYQARFQVPLNFSKYDIRDYLYHLYNIKVHNIRSNIVQSPVRDSTTAPRRFFRPEAQKFMTVEMEHPFVWPDTPEDMSPWGEKEEKKERNAPSEAQLKVKERRDGLRVQAERVLIGKPVGKRRTPKAEKEVGEKVEETKEKVKVKSEEEQEERNIEKMEAGKKAVEQGRRMRVNRDDPNYKIKI